MRFCDFLRTAVLLFATAASVLAVVSIVGAKGNDEVTLVYIAVAWWTAATAIGLWLGRRSSTSEGIRRMLSSARTTPVLPELEPGAILFNRLWAFAVLTVAAGALAFLIPQVPTVGTGYLLIMALAWRRQSAAVVAIEERDGVRFYIEPTSPFKPTRLIRTPGLRKLADRVGP